jgi:hypothetical protein
MNSETWRNWWWLRHYHSIYFAGLKITKKKERDILVSEHRIKLAVTLMWSSWRLINLYCAYDLKRMNSCSFLSKTFSQNSKGLRFFNVSYRIVTNPMARRLISPLDLLYDCLGNKNICKMAVSWLLFVTYKSEVLSKPCRDDSGLNQLLFKRML